MPEIPWQDQKRDEKIAYNAYVRWQIRPNRDAYVYDAIREAVLAAYRAGREDARKAEDQADFWFKVAVNTATRAGVYCPRCMHLISAHWPDDERQKPGCHAKERATPRPCLCSYSPQEILLYIAQATGQEHGGDGLEGYTSPRCAAGMAGCDDRACVCRCHVTESDQSGEDQDTPEGRT